MAKSAPKALDAGDQHQVETRAARLKDRQREADEEFKAMMAVPGFRAFLWRLLERTHVFEISADVGSANQTFFREGERNVGLGLMADVLRLCPEQYRAMSEEAAQRAKELMDG